MSTLPKVVKIKKLAEKGDAEAQYLMGMYHFKRLLKRGSDYEYDKAEFWLDKAVKQGHLDAKDARVKLEISIFCKFG